MHTGWTAATAGVIVGLVMVPANGPTTGPQVGDPTLSRAQPAMTVSAGHARHIQFDRWRGAALKHGIFSATRYADGGVEIGAGFGTSTYRDPYGSHSVRRYDYGRWRSPWVHTDFGLTELIASYNVQTPTGTFIAVSVRGVTATGSRSSWDGLGRWAGHDIRFHRMSLGTQADDYSSVNVDTLQTNGAHRYRAWQLRVTLYRAHGASATPNLRRIGAVATRLPAGRPPTSTPLAHRAVDLAVPRYSQETHRGEYPRYNGGGEAWCSPTSTAMVLGFWRTGPTPRQYAWVDPAYADPWVDYAARYTYDWTYDGTGNWPFNTAYAGRFDHLDAFVTRLYSLRGAQLLVDAGIPVVASIAFGPGELTGAPIRSSNGHLLVIRGFTRTGDVIVNDPAASSAAGVRRVYDRGQFERAWLPTSGGTVYVIHPPGRAPLPDPSKYSAW